ncbi:MAG: YqaE/Pmp3 family membrane protein [Rhodobacterales bacterium]|nr:YqaE/Pmp3 family membrane protein [Rhodobacterales bacterium]
MDILRIILAIFLPPVAALMTVGLGLHFWLNLVLTIFFFVPGMIHALWLVVKNRQANPVA